MLKWMGVANTLAYFAMDLINIEKGFVVWEEETKLNSSLLSPLVSFGENKVL
jgi:hypothetical protein